MYRPGKFYLLYCSRNNYIYYYYENSRIKCGCADAANYKLEKIINFDRLKYEFRKETELVYGIFVEGFRLYTEDIYWIINNVIKMRKPLRKCTNFKDFNKGFSGRFIFHYF